MIALLRAAAAARPDQLAVVGAEQDLDYGTLYRQSREVASALRRREIQRLAVVEPDVGQLIRVLGGAALAGVEVCQLQPDTPGDTVQEFLAGFDNLLTRREDLRSATTLEVADLLGGPELEVPEPVTQPVLIRTTGTTGAPKTVRHDWRVLAGTTTRTAPRPDQKWLMAYGPHQFAGFQVIQHVVACQATLVAPFPRQPRNGLQAILEHGVTCVSATPTYWRFLLAEARSLDVELPSLEQITLGGEASPPDLLADLERRFPDARISHVYASTEFGSVASVRDGLPGFPVDALHSDERPDANLRVVDGELWVRARAGMLGYVDDTDAGATADAGDEWRPTGDLVEIVDGRVLFRGRGSEVINVGGVKVHPLPVEERISALDSVAIARVYGRANPLTGAVVAVEVVPVAGADLDLTTLRAQVRDAVADLPPAWQPRSVKLVDEVETRGNKTLRRMEQE